MVSLLFLMLDQIVLLLQVDSLDQSLHLVGQPLRSQLVDPPCQVEVLLQPGDTLAVEREDLQGRDRV